MASNSFGRLFRITTWGESHGKALGVVIDGCPAGLSLSDAVVNVELARRAPGKTPYTTSRKEPDQAEILSGVFEGLTTGAPISIIIYNQDQDSSKYEPTKQLYKPGHANFTYLEKYGLFDYRGGGRSSARETVCRVAAGAIAKKLIDHYGMRVQSYVKQIAHIEALNIPHEINALYEAVENSAIYCPDPEAARRMMAELEQAIHAGDSLGAILEFMAVGMPTGLGDPVYEKLEANLAKAMMSLPATKGFEIGSGMHAATMTGSLHNDLFTVSNQQVKTETNYAGGTLGGISTGMPLYGRVAFKPTSSIKKPMKTVNTSKEEATFQLVEGSRHDPCVAIRAVPIVEAMAAIVLADALLCNRSSRL